MKRLILYLLLLSGIMQPMQAHSQDKANKFRVIGYFYNKWGKAEDIQYKYLTAINYCFATISPGDGLIKEDFDKEKLKAVVKKAKANGVDVLLAIGGPNESPHFKWFVKKPGAIKNFVKSAMQLIQKYDLAGVDIDWEYPDLKDSSAQRFTILLKELSAALKPAGKTLSVAVAARGEKADCIEQAVFDYVDYFNIMAYDNSLKYNTSHSTYTMANNSLNYWLGNRNLPAQKAVLGVPSYGRTAKTGKAVFYKDLLKKGAKADQDEWDNVHYNGLSTIARKAKLARQRGGGVAMWELNLDGKGDNSLLKAMYENR